MGDKVNADLAYKTLVKLLGEQYGVEITLVKKGDQKGA